MTSRASATTRTPNPATTAPSDTNNEDQWHDDDDDYDSGKSKRTKKMTKTILAAILLFTVGSVLLTLGVQNLPVDRDRGIAMTVIGSLTFIPGAYATWILVGTLLNWPGYDFSELPSYDE